MEFKLYSKKHHNAHPLKEITRLTTAISKAEQGNPDYMLKLGIHHLAVFADEDYGGYQNLLLGLYWLDKAGKAGKWEAYYWLGSVSYFYRRSTSGGPYYAKHHEELLESDPVFKRISEELAGEDIEQELPNAAKLYLDAYWVMMDDFVWHRDTFTNKWLKIAAEHGFTEAQLHLGINYKKCWEYWSEAMEKDPDYVINEEKIDNKKINEYLECAEFWLKQAIAGDNEEAVFELASLIKASRA